MPPSSPSPYRVLGVTPSSSAEDVRKAYARAVKARRFPVEQIRAAFSRLQDPRRRLAQDLREPDVGARLGELRDQVAGAAEAPLVDDAAVPLPEWSDLVDTDAPGWRPAPREVPAPTAEFGSARLLEPPPAAELPVPGFRLP